MAKVVRERVDGADSRRAQFLRRVGVADGVIDAADDVGAPGNLRVFDAEAGDACPAREIDKKTRHIGGAEIDGKAERRPAGRRKPDRFAVADMRTHRPVRCAQQARKVAGGGKIDGGQR